MQAKTKVNLSTPPVAADPQHDETVGGGLGVLLLLHFTGQ